MRISDWSSDVCSSDLLTASLSAVLPNQPLINIVDSSADGTKHLVYAESDVDSGRYYFFDESAKKLRQIAIERPQLAGVPLGKMTSVSYPAADGDRKSTRLNSSH